MMCLSWSVKGSSKDDFVLAKRDDFVVFIRDFLQAPLVFCFSWSGTLLFSTSYTCSCRIRRASAAAYNGECTYISGTSEGGVPRMIKTRVPGGYNPDGQNP